MDNQCDVLISLHDHSRGRTAGVRRSERAMGPAAHRQCPCCSDHQLSNSTPNQRPSAPTGIRPSVALPPEPSAEAPVASVVTPGPRPSRAPLHHGVPVMIHNRSVEEYQQLYHEVVDDMLTFKSGRVRPYSLALGRRVKQKLWERLDRPSFTSSADVDGRVHVDVSYGAGVYPMLNHVHTVGNCRGLLHLRFTGRGCEKEVCCEVVCHNLLVPPPPAVC